MPQLLKFGVVVVMLMFLFNILMTIKKAGRFTTTQGILIGGLASTALLFIPGLIHFDNYTLDRFYRWWVVHLWVEGVWELILGAMLAFLLIRLSGADREVMEKWLYVIVGLTFLSGILGTGHHYYWIGVPHYWLWVGGIFSALEPLAFLVMAMYAYNIMRRSGLSHPNTLALHWTIGSAIFSARRRNPRPGAHVAPGEPLDPWHAHHHYARPHGLLRGLCHDQSGNDHLRAAGAHRRTR